MRVIVHLSDLHFGRVDHPLIEPLLAVMKSTQPHLVAISGDLTQRARTDQFLEARAFLDRVPFPKLIVPGNHDIPLRNVFERFIRPLAKYREHITPDLSPFFQDQEIAVCGLNTARSLTTKYGRINDRQVREMTRRLRTLPQEMIKVVVTHHPFDLPPGYADQEQLVGRAERGMAALAESGVDVMLSGHLHIAHSGVSAQRYKIAGYSALVVQAGTAISTRSRGEANSFNILRLEPGRVEVERLLWYSEDGSFRLASTMVFCRGEDGWRATQDARPTPLPQQGLQFPATI